MKFNISKYIYKCNNIILCYLAIIQMIFKEYAKIVIDIVYVNIYFEHYMFKYVCISIINYNVSSSTDEC